MTKNKLAYSLIIPLWNEAKNIESLAKMIADQGLPANGMAELILVNNGSQDKTGELIDKLAKKYKWLRAVHLQENQNYGGGVYEGFRYAKTEFVGYIPGDLQVHPDDVQAVWDSVIEETSRGSSQVFCKGARTVRHDGFNTRLVSVVYTFLGNVFLGLKIKDINGLPKILHISLLDKVPEERMKTFVFDSQLLSLARVNKWTIREVPVTFHARREGVSSWSGKRFKTYIQVFKQILRLRKLRYAQGLTLKKLK